MTSPADLPTPADDASVALADGAAPTQEQWEAIAAAVLRKSGRLTTDDADARVWDKLTRTTLDGIAVTPLGTPAQVAELTTSGRPDRAGEWHVTALVGEPDPAEAAAVIATDLDNGVTALWLRVGAAGVPVAGLAEALAGVLLDVAPVTLEADDDTVAAAQAFVAAVPAGTTVAAGTVLGTDPWSRALRSSVTVDHAGAAAELAALASAAATVGARAVMIDATAAHDAGASDVQELGWSIAAGTAALRALVAEGRTVEEAAALIAFRYAASDEQFPTIAKLRAARRLWSRVLELSGAAEESRRQYQTVVTSRPMMSSFDPWVNMLRTCVAAFSAGVGGADAITVLPFDAPLGLPDAFSRRIARNTSALLLHESHLAKVTDPAGGSFAVEKLTDDLAVAGWSEFGVIEEAGGAAAALAEGSVAARIAAVVADREAQIARRKRPITGVSEFPNLAETLPERRPHPAGAWSVTPYGHAFEALRRESAVTPVFLATMGSIAAHTARATFVSNLFAAGGIDVVNPGRHDDVAAVLASYRGPDGGQPVVCLAGNDKDYAAWGADVVVALRDAGARWVILAGRAPDGVVVDDSCAIGVDALTFLTRTREKLA